LRANSQLIAIKAVNDQVFAKCAWLEIQPFCPHEFDIGVSEQTDLPMPIPGMCVAVDSVFNQNGNGGNFVLGDALLCRYTNMQQCSISHEMPPRGSLRFALRT